MSSKHYKDDGSLWSRSVYSGKNRQRQRRRRIFLLFICVLCIAGIGVLTARLIKMGKGNEERKTVKQQETPGITPKITPTAEPEITQEPVQAVSGSALWLRADLDASKPMVALTFDDGPYAPVTKRIMDAVESVDGRATFFMVGNRISSYSDTLKDLYSRGHEVASHTYDHSDLSKMKKKGIKNELGKTDNVIEKNIGCKTTILRPPYGNVSDVMRKTIKVPMIYWSIDSEDWKSRNEKKILKRCEGIKDGDIVLFHDLYETTAQAVEKLAPQLQKKGIQLVTVDELLYYKNINPKGGKVYFSGR